MEVIIEGIPSMNLGNTTLKSTCQTQTNTVQLDFWAIDTESGVEEGTVCEGSGQWLLLLSQRGGNVANSCRVVHVTNARRLRA